MKKTILLLASVALLLVGCAKEQIVDMQQGELTNVTFTANLDNGVATKASADNDGDGANVTRCVLELYFGNQFYNRLVEPVTGNVATFANVPVVAGKEYQILCWADCGGGTDKRGDKYYTTKTETDNKGLKSVAVKKTEFTGALAAGRNDDLDAFFGCVSHIFQQQQETTTLDIQLHRPFAQLNVITTDVAEGKAVFCKELLPDSVSVSYTAATKINVATGDVSEDATYTYVADVYGDWSTVSTNHELTLSMDYILAPKTEQGAIDVTFKTKNGSTEVMTHNLTNLPYQRNYRTNVKGDLLTVGGTWTATIDADWEDVINRSVVIANTLAEAQAAIGPTSGEAASTVIVKQEAVTSRDTTKDKSKSDIISKTAGIEDKLPNGAKAIEFILTPRSQKDVTFELPKLPEDQGGTTFYWYIRHETGYPTENLNVKVATDDATRVIIDAPDNTHVVLNDVEYEHVIAITGENTLVVPQGIKVDKLTVKKGGVEIHGEVGNLEITGTEEDVFFRSCEGLSATVFAEIKGTTPSEHNFIDKHFGEKQNGDKWDIVPAVVLAGSLDNPTAGYVTLEQAIAAETTGTLFLTADIETAAEIVVGESKDITLNLNGHNINSGNNSAFQIFGGKLKIEGAGEISGTPTNHKEIYLKGSTESSAVDYSVLSVGPQVSVKCNAGYTIMISQNEGVAYGVKIDIQGSVEGKYGALYVNGTIQALTGNIPVITVNGKLIVDEENAAIYAAGYAKYIINEEAVLTGSDAMYICGGDVEISGGTFRAIGPARNFKAVTSGYEATGEAIVVDSREGYAKPIKLCIKGGDFSSENNRPVGSYPDGSETKWFIQGGTYSAELPASYIDEGYEQTKQSDGRYLVQGRTAAHLNGHDYITIAKALEAFGEITESGNYDLTIEPGIYRESDLMLIIQNPDVQKTLTIKPVSERGSVTIMPGDKSKPLALFVIGAESNYSGAAIVFDGINIDLSDTPTPTKDMAPYAGTENTPYLPVFYMAGARSGEVDGIVDVLCPGRYDGNNNPRYGHNITIKNCSIIGNGVDTQVLVGNTGTSGITVENCTASNFGYFANGYFTDNANYNWKGLTIKGGTYNSEKVFVNRQNGTHTLTIEDCQVTAKHDYVVRTDGGIINLKYSSFTSSYSGDAGDAGIIVTRKESATLTVDDNCTFNKVSTASTKDIYCIGGGITLNGSITINAGSGYNFTE